MNTVVEFPTLYGLSKNGAVKQWRTWVELNEEGYPAIYTEHGQKGGQLQLTSKPIKKGRNLGRANEVSAWQAAINDAESNWKKKQDSNYRTEIPDKDSITLLPMLANRYQDQSHKIKWPCFVQRKLNGMRCLSKRVSEDKFIFTSKKGKEIKTLDHIITDLKRLQPVGTILDGELFNPNLSFQEIMKRSKRLLTDRSDIENDPIQYHIYDLIELDTPFKVRVEKLANWFLGLDEPLKNVQFVDTWLVMSEEKLKELHIQFVGEGYEGTMIRNTDGLYLPDYRSVDLQKYKDHQDAEYKIVGGHEGTGRDAGTIIFEVETEDGQQFSVRPKGSWEQRKEWWDNLDRYIGQYLTVKFQELSDTGIPIFPVGLSIRDMEMDG